MARRGRPGPGWLIAGTVAVLAAAGLAAGLAAHSHLFLTAAHAPVRHERHPQASWAACNRNAHSRSPSTFRPLSDARAAALVTHEPETRPDNARPYLLGGVRYPGANDYVPSAAQLAGLRRARTSTGQPLFQFNPYLRYVDGRDGLRHPSTDDLIQWAAHKWGIPEDWLRAEYVYESYWNQFMLGDDTPVGRAYGRYPSQSRIRHSDHAYQSLGITQVRWTPDGSLNPGSEPLRWRSTAFDIDWQAATLRLYYDNPSGSRSSWGDGSYKPCQQWNSIGGWYRPYPWGNPDQHRYAAAVRHILGQREWRSSSFLDWSPSSLPPGIRLR